MSKNGSRADVLIIGGGISGCSIAYFLAKAGVKVLVLERDAVAGQASGGAAGMLSVESEPVDNKALHEAGAESRALYSGLSAEFKELGIDIFFEDSGILCLAHNEESRQALKEKMGRMAHSEWLSPETVRTMAPEIKGKFLGALLCRSDGQVASGRATAAFCRAAQAAGARVEEGCEVIDFIRERNRILGVKTKKGEYQAAQTVLTAGPWTGNLTKDLRWKFPIRPVRGQILIFEMAKRILPWPVVIFETPYYLVPKGDGFLYVGTTQEEVGFDTSVTEMASDKISQAAMEMVPAVGDLPLRGSWAGLRPFTPDGLPALGRVPSWVNLWVAAGHFRRGILLAPFTGKAMTSLILGKISEDDLESFSPSRFQS